MKVLRFAAIFILLSIVPLCAQARTLKVGVSFYDPPFVTLGANNQFYGFDISLMQHICKTIKHQCQFIPMPFNTLLEAIKTNQVDLAVSSIIITPERAAKSQFSSPYLVSKTRFIALKLQQEGPFTIQSLMNKKVGVSDEVFAEQLKSMGVNSQIVVFKDDSSLIQGLNQRKIDFGLIDNPTAIYWQEHSSGMLGIKGKPMLYGLGLGIAISQANLDLLDEINMALLEYQSSDDFINDYHKYLSHFSHADTEEF
ncbi:MULTISPECIES: transporter substrate-binding domain-containing protein [Legionella]|uniref:Putative amino acid ABC transporter, periplasmic binding protein n=1 Tax=Legionella maceachernii TaxID=466 RepID=A0A0W0VW36_9GAMM|nr:transporter substrate-binding domain-containing protein [Legionella maceachernii]KTD24234.1 putative amino acid ABC transporter, periplasmic binding protein [Legionella maceachernii]SJZ89765.1 arginine transport system substrate-binding protein [Legionella maceachernii]SUO98750.1 Putative ABC transporter arginine-binding protein 2 precursor [Legionella maceachernii]